MSFDVSSLETSLQGSMGPYMMPIVVLGAIGLAVWIVLTFRALQAYNQTDAAKLERFLKQR